MHLSVLSRLCVTRRLNRLNRCSGGVPAVQYQWVLVVGEIHALRQFRFQRSLPYGQASTQEEVRRVKDCRRAANLRATDR